MDLLRPHNHKIASGYHLRHDMMMGVGNLNRQLLMTYFIGSQTPWKLNPEDRSFYTTLSERYSLLDSRNQVAYTEQQVSYCYHL